MKMRNPIHPLVAALALTLFVPVQADDIAKASKSTADANYSEHKAAAEATYDAAKKQCDALSGNDKDVCVKQAKADYQSAKAQAKAENKSSKAQAEANEDVRLAHYKVAKEKCDALSGDAKDACVAKAKIRYNQ